MTSKERVLLAVDHREPDRVPLDFSANTDTLERLKEALGVTSHRELLERLRVDIVDLRGVLDPVYRGPVPKEKILDDGIKENYWGMRTREMMTATGIEESYVDFILSGCQTLEELQAHRWPSTDWFDFSDFSMQLEPWKDFAIMASGASVWQHPTFLRSMEILMTDMLAQPELAGFMLDTFTDFYVNYFDTMFRSAPGRIDILRIADDLGTQHGLLFSVDQFSQIIAPRIKRLVDMAHGHGVKVMFHSCGSIMPLIDPLIELGVDILDPIQVSADNMDPQVIKERFGDRICLHGSIDTQFLLTSGTPDEVRASVREMISLLGKGGGFILAPSHVLQTDVPTENILAIYDMD